MAMSATGWTQFSGYQVLIAVSRTGWGTLLASHRACSLSDGREHKPSHCEEVKMIKPAHLRISVGIPGVSGGHS